MELTDIRKDNRVDMTNGRKGTVLEVFPLAFPKVNGRRRKPRVVVALDNKPTMSINVAASQVNGLA
jgi:hypothetical protein